MLRAMGEVSTGLAVEVLSDWPLRMTCQSNSSLTSAERMVYEFAMATIGDAGSTTTRVPFSLSACL